MAKLIDVESIGSYFEALPDPRHTRNRRHLLKDIAVIAVCGIICGCPGPTAIHSWARNRLDWLRQHLALPNGLPSRDCIRRVLLALKPAAFQACFQAWLADAVPDSADGSTQHIAIDGKTCRRSHDRGKELGALHIVSAWASDQGIALGQVATDDKSNEITAIPQLLTQIDLRKALISIDAIGCQKEIVEQIADGGGDFVIAVKDNQPTLRAEVEALCQEQLECDREDMHYRRRETVDEGHGRRDERSYHVAKLPKDSAIKDEWPSVKAVGFAIRITTLPDGTETSDVRYYICGSYLSGKRFADAVRKHWSIEAMHWVLDVNFREDDSRTRERTLGNNLSWLRRFAVTLLKRHPSEDSLVGKMRTAGWNTDFLTEVLTQAKS